MTKQKFILFCESCCFERAHLKEIDSLLYCEECAQMVRRAAEIKAFENEVA